MSADDLGDGGSSPFGELEGHVLDDVVPAGDDERAELLGERVAELLRLAVDDEEDASRAPRRASSSPTDRVRRHAKTVRPAMASYVKGFTPP